MDSMIKEINENLKAIIDNIRENRDNSISVLDNIQNQMDKKVEEAKKYKIQVDSAKERIKELEDENKSLEASLNELNDKYSKMNLVSLIEAGNKEIKNKINDNLKNINKEKEHIAELTNKARTIKDLLINLKKDKTLKEEKLENIKVIYEYFNERINEVTDYALDHANNLSDYKGASISDTFEEDSEDIKNIELENTMVFDEIANIDDNRNFKDEMSFISDQIDENISSTNTSDEENLFNEDVSENAFDEAKFNEIIKRSLNEVDNTSNEKVDDEVNDEPLDTTQVFDNIFNNDDNALEDEDVEEPKDIDEESSIENVSNEIENNNEIIEEVTKEDNTTIDSIHNIFDQNDNAQIIDNNFESDTNSIVDESNFNNIDTNLFEDETNNNNVNEVEDKENEERINKINDLFSTIDDINTNTNTNIPVNDVKPFINTGLEDQIDNAYKDVFGVDINENDLNKKEPTLTDIFGNPINNEELSEEVKKGKQIEELFTENGLDFNRFREDEKNYLKQIYDENKYTSILEILKKNKINLDNIYNSFNIFGEINPNELEDLINKLINIGQSVEAIGIVLEKLPKLKKYNLDEAILSYGDYVKDVDITELIMKSKELYDNGGNR